MPYNLKKIRFVGTHQNGFVSSHKKIYHPARERAIFRVSDAYRVKRTFMQKGN